MMDTAIAKVDCAAHQEFCRKQQIAAYPTLRLFYKGEKFKGDYKSDRTVQVRSSEERSDDLGIGGLRE